MTLGKGKMVTISIIILFFIIIGIILIVGAVSWAKDLKKSRENKYEEASEVSSSTTKPVHAYVCTGFIVLSYNFFYFS